METPMERPKVVAVRAYLRWRMQRLEPVCAHWRRWPMQLPLPFG